MPALRDDLLRWYQSAKRDLPWRRMRDPYAIWISEVMLQQTQVATVIPYWERFLARFPDVRALAEAEDADVLSLWRGLGYYSRARNLHRAAKEIVARFSGALPSTVAELESLPGFGRYTAGAVASIAFGQPAPLVDGNVARVLSRLFEVEGAPGDRARDKELWRLAGELVGGDDPGGWNQALMELGATVCRPDSPLCLLCPVRGHCGAHRHGRTQQLPPARVRPERKPLKLACAALRRSDRIWLARRGGDGLFGGLWELPSVEIASDLGDEAAAELLSAALHLEVTGTLGAVRRTLTHRELELVLFETRGRKPKKLAAHVEDGWFSRDEWARLGMSTAMQKALALATAR